MEIQLNRGFVVVIDDIDFELVRGLPWRARTCKGQTYAAFQRHNPPPGEPRVVFMHRLIAGTPEDKITDHRDGDTLNNRRKNLRVCTQPENTLNRKLNRNNKTGYKGVSITSDGCIQGAVGVGGARVRKNFDTVEAANEWCIKERELRHGEYVRHS